MKKYKIGVIEELIGHQIDSINELRKEFPMREQYSSNKEKDDILARINYLRQQMERQTKIDQHLLFLLKNG